MRGGGGRGKQVGVVRRRRTQPREGAVWTPPRRGEVKVNVDGAVFRGVGVGMGVVIRDNDGECTPRSLPAD